MLKKTLSLLFTIFVLVGCETTGGKKQTIGTVVGAVGGAVIGAQFGSGTGQVVGTAIGTAAGALAGGYVGKKLDDEDSAKSIK